MLCFSYGILQKLFLPSATGQKKKIRLFIPEKRRTVEKHMLPQYLSFTFTDILFCSELDAKHWDVRLRMTREKFLSEAPFEI